MSEQPHFLSLVEASVAANSDAIAFRLPQLDPQTGRVQRWAKISYKQFWEDVQSSARHWARILQADGVSKHSIVGIWLYGTKYTDLVQVYGVWRAGYIPQLISFLQPNSSVVYSLLSRSGAKALISSPGLREKLDEASPNTLSIPIYIMTDIGDIVDDDDLLPDLSEMYHANDPVIVLHTSGSTSGTPKLVPYYFDWLQSHFRKSNVFWRSKAVDGGPVVTVWVGNICHSGQNLNTIFNLLIGACIVQPTTLDYSPEELTNIVKQCGLNRLVQFAGLMAKYFEAARKDPNYLALLKKLDDVSFSGLPLSRRDEEWAIENGIKLRCLFGSTESGILLISKGGDSLDSVLCLSMAPGTGCSHAFVPVSDGGSNDSKLLELVVLSSSPDCPDISLRSKEDGHFHTGDLFEEAQPGLYASRGRNDDWIKLYAAGRCDTRAIENNVKETCGDLIDQCVVVGSGRLRVALVAELLHTPGEKPKIAEIKSEVISRIAPFHSKLLLHERLTNPSMILVVPSGQLQRTATKGNIRRKAVEEMFLEDLDKLYGEECS